MQIIPAISIKDSRIVEVEQGFYRPSRTDDGSQINAPELILDLKGNYESLFLLDIDGIERNEPDLKLMQRISPLMPVWADAGSREEMGVMDILVAGCSKAVIGTRNIHDFNFIKKSLEMTENIIVSIDYDNGPVSAEGTTDLIELAGRLENIGVKALIFFNHGRLSGSGGLARDEIRLLVPHFEKVYVAGIFDASDIDELRELGIAGAIADYKKLRSWGLKNPGSGIDLEDDESPNEDYLTDDRHEAREDLNE